MRDKPSTTESTEDPRPNKPNNKYLRPIFGKPVDNHSSRSVASMVDVYDVLIAFRVECPARAHAVKKLLCAGKCGKGDAIQDLEEAIVAINRAIEEVRKGTLT